MSLGVKLATVRMVALILTAWKGLKFPTERWPTSSPIVFQAKRDLIVVIKSRIFRRDWSKMFQLQFASCRIQNGLRCGVLCWIHR